MIKEGTISSKTNIQVLKSKPGQLATTFYYKTRKPMRQTTFCGIRKQVTK